MIIRRDNRRGARDNRAPINDQIRANEVRLIGADGEQVGVVSLREALEAAQEAELDLVQISDGDPIVCKIMDFGKKLYEEKKQKAEAKKKQHQVQIKEVKFRPGTEEGDYQIKLRNLKRFLEAGNKAKVSLRFRGREMAHQNLGMELMMRVEKDLEELGSVEQRPKMEGRQMIMVIGPSKKK
ncbi:MAG: translation initiation factor IF-3 [Thalassolituus maritimus]|nr:translation initiation factor IF-3 [Thalassolituus sp.]MAX85921.1 translation initiation factor IF-3 [Oceanospirillaceae bacterium]MEC8524455.1 translation initiation factor IF-3 [Pseudomonadota bacterium]TPD54044.1 MAG: translation initiation factor IF-3 [Thalassolituus maritimus]MED5440867.1 translation initiation factor IF-3 [Pseudomonadota bacterium]MEE3159908.1 translation initiation factor IF-3 [Pseudomonadota bacterium]